MNVSDYISSLKQLFSINHRKAIDAIVPLERGHVKATAELEKGVVSSVSSVLNFSKGKVITIASSSAPSSIKLSSSNLIPYLSISTTVFNDNRKPLEIKSAFRSKEVHGHEFYQCLRLTFKVLPISREMVSPTNIGSEVITKISNKTNSLKLCYIADTNSFAVDVLTRSLPNVLFGMKLTTNGPWSHVGAKVLASTKFGSYDVAAVFDAMTKKIEYIFHHTFDHDIKSGIIVGIDHIGSHRNMNLIGKIATSFYIDKDSSVQLVGGLDGSISGKLLLKYQDFLNFQFSETVSRGISGYEGKFGAVVTFNLGD